MSNPTHSDGADVTAAAALFSPFQIGPATLKNRLVMAPMSARLCPDGTVSDAEVAWVEERARGGVGLVIAGGTLVHPTSGTRGNPGGLVEGWRESGVEGQRRRVEAVHRHGGKVFAQLLHAGRDAAAGAVGALLENPVLAPSAIRSSNAEWAPKAMDKDDIAMITSSFGVAARHLGAAGVDGLEIHGAHNYLIGQFLSPMTNRRSDEYGSLDLDSRMRFLFDVLRSVREEVGDDLPIGVRLSATEEMPDGITVDDTCSFVERLEASGLVHYVHLSVGVRGSYVKDNTFPPGFTRPYAEKVRGATGLPLILAGRLMSPDVAQSLVTDGVVDLVGLGRALIADPEWPRKAQAELFEEIRPCLALAQDCRMSQGGITCAVNPAAGRETRWSVHQIEPGPIGQRIVVVGGGPGGLEAARLAAQRRNDVILLEAEDRLGGQLRRAARLPHRENWADYAAHLEHEVYRLGVDVRVGMTATAQHVLVLGPSAVIVATGSVPSEQLPFESTGGTSVIRTWDLVDGTEHVLPSRVAVVDDGTGFWEVCGAADLLAARGVRLDLVTPHQSFGRSIPPESLAPLYARLRRAGAVHHPLSRLEELGDGKIVIANVVTGKHTTLIAAAVVLHLAGEPRAGLASELAAHDPALPVHVIGDAVQPRRLTHATLDAHTVVRRLGGASPTAPYFHPTSDTAEPERQTT